MIKNRRQSNSYAIRLGGDTRRYVMTMKEMADKLGLNYREIRLGYHLTNNPNKLMPGKIEYVTMHQTDNTGVGVDAYQHHKYLANNSQGREASWHWTVDEQEAVQSFRDNRVMYHSATPEGNNKSLAIEMCIDADVAGKTYMGETNYRKTIDNGAKLAAIKLVEYGLSVADIRQYSRLEWLRSQNTYRSPGRDQSRHRDQSVPACRLLGCRRYSGRNPSRADKILRRTL